MGCWMLDVGSWRLEVGGFGRTRIIGMVMIYTDVVRGWKLEVGGWRLEVRCWRYKLKLAEDLKVVGVY